MDKRYESTLTLWRTFNIQTTGDLDNALQNFRVSRHISKRKKLKDI